MVWNESWMWGRTGSRTSSRGQFSSATFGITRETDFPAWTILIWRSNIKWKGKTWQKICGETSGCAATSSKSSGNSRSNSFVVFALLGVFGVRGVTGPISVIKNWMWSATWTSGALRTVPLPCWKCNGFGQVANSSLALMVVISFTKKAVNEIIASQTQIYITNSTCSASQTSAIKQAFSSFPKIQFSFKWTLQSLWKLNSAFKWNLIRMN